MSRGPISYARSGDVSIAYQVVGDGPRDIVMVPGWVSNLEASWEDPDLARAQERLASFSRLILFDKRGTGLSDRVPASDLPSLETRMDDVRAVMDVVGSERAALFGASEGGSMAILFAATYPHRTAALIGFGMFATRHWSPEYPWAPTTERREAWLSSLAEHWDDVADIETIAPSRAHDERYRAWFGSYMRRSASPGAAVALGRMNTDIDVRAVLPTIRVPALVLHRAGDRDADVEEGRFIASRIPGAKFVELPGQDHLFWTQDVDAVVDEIEEFLTGVRRGPEPDRVLATVLFTDIVGSTARAVKMGDRHWMDALEAHRTMVRWFLERFHGREVDTAGDGFFATFDGPARAIRCALAVRDAARERDIDIRAGLHTGEVEMGEKPAGVAVHIGARVMGEAGAGEVFVSQTVKDLVAGSGISFEDRGPRTLKGVPGVWDLFLAGPEFATRPAAAQDRPQMSGPETRYTRTEDGFHIAYQVLGEGPVDIVYIPGWFSNVDLMWDEPDIAPFLRRLARSSRLIVFDRRGTGVSDEVSGAPHLDAMLDDIRAVMDAVGSERAVLVGVTVGAAIACLFAATYPERTLGLALIHADARTAWAPDHPWGDTPEEHHEETELIGRGWGTGEFERWFLSDTGHPDDPDSVARTARYLRNSLRPHSAVLTNETWIQTDVRDVLPAVHVPALVFEKTRSPEASRALADRLPLSEMVSLPGEFRTPWVPGGERTADELIRFARDLHAQAAGLERVLATVLFTDIVDSTAKAAGLGDARWRETREAHDRAVRANLARFRGREIKTLGDGFLATFDGPARAVRCATAIAQAVRSVGVEIRAGVHTGEIELEGDDVAGIAVAIAARVAAFAGPGEVLTSQTVKDLTAGSGLTFEDAGEHELKGVPDRWRLYRVVS